MGKVLRISCRPLANAVLFLSLFFFPWWVTAILSIGAIFLFKKFYEVFLWAFAADFLYGTPVTAFYGFSFFMILGALIAYLGVEWLKTRMRFYK